MAAGIELFAANMDRAIELSGTWPNVTVLLENTAGQGTQLGSSFEEIALILEASRFGASLGVCFDTCHGFAAGYDLRTPETYAATFSRFDRLVGLDRLRFFHLNDSKKDLAEDKANLRALRAMMDEG